MTELQDRELPGAYHKLRFEGPEAPIWIDTTRPELLPSCVALVAHPDDERYQPLFGQTARTPLFGVEVPIVAHELAAGREPRVTGADPGLPVPTSHEEAGPQILVLLAERDPRAADLEEYFLRTEGYQVEVSWSAEEAAVGASAMQPDVAVV